MQISWKTKSRQNLILKSRYTPNKSRHFNNSCLWFPLVLIIEVSIPSNIVIGIVGNPKRLTKRWTQTLLPSHCSISFEPTRVYWLQDRTYPYQASRNSIVFPTPIAAGSRPHEPEWRKLNRFFRSFRLVWQTIYSLKIVLNFLRILPSNEVLIQRNVCIEFCLVSALTVWLGF